MRHNSAHSDELLTAPGYEAVRDKLTGRGTFSVDLNIDRMAHAKLLRSPHPHARIREIQCAQARCMPGVICIITADDMAEIADPFYGVYIRDQPIIARDRARHVGDPVAGVVAETESQALAAVRAINVTYEILPTIADPHAALAPDAMPLFDEPTRGHNIPVGPLCGATVEPSPNILHEFHFGYGETDSLLASAPHLFTDRFDISRITHFHLEPHVNIARWVGERLEIWSCNQDPFLIRADLARIFGISNNRVRVHSALVGGGFGGKSYCKMEPLVALMARKAGRAVRLALSLDESLHTLVKHPATLQLTTAVDREGHLLARRADITLDGGAYADASVLVGVKTAFRIGGPYRWRALSARARVVRTSNIPSGSFRGFGGTQASFASERQIDQIARRLGDDPVAFRHRNMLAPGEPFAPNDSGMDCNLSEGLNELLRRMGPRANNVGRGIAVGLKDAGGTGNHAQALVRVSHAGEVMVHAALVDIGQGAPSALCRIATNALGMRFAAASYAPIDTSQSPQDNGTHVSCGTMVTGEAVRRAACAVRRQMVEFLCKQTNCEEQDIDFANWCIRTADNDRPIEPIVRAYYGGVGWDFVGTGYFKEPFDPSAPLAARNMSWMPCWSAADVSVNHKTGVVTVHRLVVGADAGNAIDPLSCEGQLEGAAMQALGQAMFEELSIQDAMPVNAEPSSYRIARAADVPQHFSSFITEHGMGPGPDGAKGIGEAGMLGVAAAIANAIADACGAEMIATPFTPERILSALDQASPEVSK